MAQSGQRNAGIVRAGTIIAVVGGLLFLGSHLQPPPRGAEFDDPLNRAFAPRPSGPPADLKLPDYIKDPLAAKRRVNDMVRRSKGEFSHLAPDEQRWLNSVTAGHAEVMVRRRWGAMVAEMRAHQPPPGAIHRSKSGER